MVQLALSTNTLQLRFQIRYLFEQVHHQSAKLINCYQLRIELLPKDNQIIYDL